MMSPTKLSIFGLLPLALLLLLAAACGKQSTTALEAAPNSEAKAHSRENTVTYVPAYPPDVTTAGLSEEDIDQHGHSHDDEHTHDEEDHHDEHAHDEGHHEDEHGHDEDEHDHHDEHGEDHEHED